MMNITAELLQNMSDAEVFHLLSGMNPVSEERKRQAWDTMDSGIYDSSGALVGESEQHEDEYSE